jgi:microcystin-dependent protein
MAKSVRVTGKVFGGSAPLDQIGQFGSAKAGTPTNTQDVAEIQSLQAYSNGWGSAIVTSRNFPPIEEVTGVLKTISYQNCYLLQEGAPEYDINTEYSNTSIVKSVNGNELIFYISLQKNNIGHPLTDTSYWARAVFAGSTPIGAPQITLNFNATLPENCIWLEGAEVSRTTYSILFGIYGTTYGVGDGSTTFKLPDFRNRAIWGANSAGYLSAGLPNITGQVTLTGVEGVNGSGVFYSDGSSYGRNGGHENYTMTNKVGFNASRSNSIYGNSTTVQPQAIKVRVYTRYQ